MSSCNSLRYVFPAVSNNVYNTKSLGLFGDGRCDFPGYSAKYIYTLTKSKSGEILDFNVIHFAQAGNSAKNGTGWSKIVANFIQIEECNCNPLNDRSTPTS